MELDGIIGVVEHGIIIGIPEITVVVAGTSGVRIAGADGEAPWCEHEKQLIYGARVVYLLC